MKRRILATLLAAVMALSAFVVVPVGADDVSDLIRGINDLPDLYSIDIYHFERDITSLQNKYNALSSIDKAYVTNYNKLKAAADKIAGLREWNDNKQVNLLNSTLRGFSAYNYNYLRSLEQKQSIGIYYYFEEVGFIEDEGDPNTGYYDIDPNNEKVKLYSYAKLEMAVNVTDLDFNQCWPAFKFNVGGDFWAGYDFVNGAFFIAKITKWSHGRFVDYRAFEGKEWDLGVWHHLCLEWNGESLAIAFDGEKVLDAQYDGTYQYLIMYPWSCNLELTNVQK